MGVGEACPIKGAYFLGLNKLLEFLEFSSSAEVEEILFVVAVVRSFTVLHLKLLTILSIIKIKLKSSSDRQTKSLLLPGK
jgi:hypothetical protein